MIPTLLMRWLCRDGNMGTMLVVLVALLGLCRADSDLKCDNVTKHEVLQCRYPCPPQRTCQNLRGPEPPCYPYPGPCTDQCVCADGYARNTWGGICVTVAQCDKCPGNNQYFSCDGPYSEECAGSCHCADGYERDANNTCVSTTPPPEETHPVPPPPPIIIPSQPVDGPQPITDGPRSVILCNTLGHEVPACVFEYCPPERTCQNVKLPLPVCGPTFLPCKPKCVCDEGYARNQKGGPCVTLEQCDLECNMTNHEIAGCIYGCPPERTCQNRHWPPPPCAPPTFPCTPKCICDNGYTRNQNGGTCVTEAQCDKCCENEYFQCDGDYSENCVGHCYCYSGYTQDINDKCVYVDPASPPKDNGPPAPEPEGPSCSNY